MVTACFQITCLYLQWTIGVLPSTEEADDMALGIETATSKCWTK